MFLSFRYHVSFALALGMLVPDTRAFAFIGSLLTSHDEVFRAAIQHCKLTPFKTVAIGEGQLTKLRRWDMVGRLNMSESDEDFPSDTGSDAYYAVAEDDRQRKMSSLFGTETPEVAQLKLDLLRLAALTGRGELEKAAERDRVEDIIRKLEIYTPIEATATSEALEGRWALAYGSDDPTRSSPFFWAFSKAMENLRAPFGGGKETSMAARIYAITDSIPGKSIGEVIQTITVDQIRSEVEVFAGASAGNDRRSQGPASFPSFRSVMTTTSDIVSATGKETKLRVAKTQVRKSAIGRLLKPLFNLDDVEIPSGSLLEPLREGASEATMRTTFLDGYLRITRTEENQFFVFVRDDEGELE